jgi:myosin-15
MDHKPTIKETKFLLPKPALSARDIKPPQWVNMVTGINASPAFLES